MEPLAQPPDPVCSVCGREPDTAALTADRTLWLCDCGHEWAEPPVCWRCGRHLRRAHVRLDEIVWLCDCGARVAVAQDVGTSLR